MNALDPLRQPGHEFGVMPFWFWNDCLDDQEIIRQIADFQAHGVGGFVIHPRIGLPEELGWMSARLLDHYAVAIEEAARRGLKVLLYDEGMYPSGSSAGQVVAENPAFACRCLDIQGLDVSSEPVLADDHHLVAICTRVTGERLAIIDRRAASHIRGLHYRGDGPEEITHPAADILNPDAVACFIRLVYQQFTERFAKYFGETIIGIFTDEPSALGRPEERGVRAGNAATLAHVSRLLGYDFTPHLPALWFEDEPDAQRHRANYARAIALRLEETLYQPLQAWCEANGLPLAGHPGAPDDIGCLRHFHIPGQDLVWRDVLPDHSSALEGPQSTQAKCSASAALHGGRRRNLNECCGAYGHDLSYEEMLWLANWCLIRGVNLIVPHAFYYSVRGARRDERPPDVGPNSPWWNRFPGYAAHCRHLSWLNTDSRQVCELAILGTADHLPWRLAKFCYQHQIDFNYIEERDLLDRASCDAEGIHIAGMRYRVLLCEHEPEAAVGQAITVFRQAGRLIHAEEDRDSSALLLRIRQWCQPDIQIDPPCSALRVRHVRKDGHDWYMVFNETCTPVRVRLTFSALVSDQTGESYWSVNTSRTHSAPLLMMHRSRLLPTK